MKLTRRVQFSSGHRYWLPDRSPEENRRLFGRWASSYNHGHNYTLDVTIEGRINSSHGMVVNIKTLDAILRERVVARLDGKSLNDEVHELKERSPSLENLSLLIWDAVPPVPEGTKLHSLRLYEMPALFTDVTLKGGQPHLQLTRVYEFCAAHRLHCPDLPAEKNIELFGKCNNPHGHGHNYVLEVSVSGDLNPVKGMIADIEELDRIVNTEVVDRYDHKHLNEDLPEFRGINPTSEVLTREIWNRLNGRLPAKLERVRLRETARNIFEYSGEDS